MGRTVVAELSVEKHFKGIQSDETHTVGFIIGQRTSQRDLVIWACDTPFSPAAVEEEEGENEDAPSPTLAELEPTTVAEYATQVRWCLPGGLNILGIYVMADKKDTEDVAMKAKLRQTLTAIGQDASLLLLFTQTSSPSCCIIEGTETKPADWKYVRGVTKWHQLHANFKVVRDIPLDKKQEHQKLFAQLMEGVKDAKKQLDSALFMIEGELRSGKEALNTEDRNRVTPRIFQVDILTSDPPCSKKVHHCYSTLEVIAQVAGRAYVHQKCTVAEAIAALKQDLARTMEARLHLHTDFVTSVMDTEDPLMVHETPRRVLIPFPHCDVTVSDYLFPGQGPETCVEPIRDLLSLTVHPADVNDDLEASTNIAAYDDPVTALPDDITPGRKLEGLAARNGPLTMQLGVMLVFSVVFAILAFYMAAKS